MLWQYGISVVGVGPEPSTFLLHRYQPVGSGMLVLAAMHGLKPSSCSADESEEAWLYALRKWASEPLIDEDGERILVTSWSWLALALLRSHIGWCAYQPLSIATATLLHYLGHAKVTE